MKGLYNIDVGVTEEAKQLAGRSWTRPVPGASPPLLRGPASWLTRAHPASPYVVCAPLIGVFVVFAPRSAASLGAFFAGVGVWTAVEYALHRWAFHFPRSNPVLEVAGLLVHGHHHLHPADPRGIVATPAQSLSLFALLAGVASLVLLPLDAMALWLPLQAGWLAGYLAYEWSHWSAHHRRPKTRWGRAMRRYHLRHHLVDDACRWGISTPLWDWALGTAGPRETKNVSSRG